MQKSTRVRSMLIVVFILSLLCLVVVLDGEDRVRPNDMPPSRGPSPAASLPPGPGPAPAVENPDRPAASLNQQSTRRAGLENRSVRRLRS